MPYVLDTDTTTALQQKNPYVTRRVGRVPASELFFTVISFEEQCQGRLAAFNKLLNDAKRIEAYQRLMDTLEFYQIVNVLPYDAEAVVKDVQLRDQRRMGTHDRRIAAITLAHGHTLVTRNTRHFKDIIGLALEDWMVP